MKKIKITQEQADAIEKYKAEQRKLHEESKGVHDVQEWTKPLLELDSNEFMDALYIGYEVEQEYKVGDWVVYIHDNTVWEVIGELYGGKVHYDITRNGKHKGSVHKDHIRLATPSEIAEEKERRFWKMHGRNVWELKKGDVLIKNYSYFLIVEDVTNSRKHIIADKESQTVTMYQGKDNKKAWPMDRIKNEFNILVFAENRLDVKTNGTDV